MAAEGALYREVRYFKRGAVAQWFAFLAACCVVGTFLTDSYRPPLVGAGVLLFVPFLLRFETFVDREKLRTTVWPFWRRTIAVSDIVETEATIWDGQVGFFGGYSSRNSLAGAVITSWEGDRSVGNRAVVLTLRSGKEHQLGTFHPSKLIEALERASSGSTEAGDEQ